MLKFTQKIGSRKFTFWRFTAPTIPSLDVLRHAKKEAIDEKLGTKKKQDEDIIQAIYRLNFENPYKDSISAVSYYPFRVSYGTSEQISLYKQYCRINKNSSSISIATGSVVRKLQRLLETKSAHIFLYLIVVHFDDTSLSVYQLLTESQETETIEHWLKMWLRTVNFQKPMQVVVDYLRAMLLACSKVFNDITIKKYNEICFKAACKKEHPSRNWISTYIQIDVAHIIHMLCRWPILKTHPLRAVRDFYIRCIALIIDCQNWQDFIEIFSLTCIVAFQNYQNSIVNIMLLNPEIKTAKQSQEMLETLIAERPSDFNNYLNSIDSADDYQLNNNIHKVHDVHNDKTEIDQLFEKIRIESQSVISEGKETNFF